ncbi:MAG: hypothetical protein R3211_12390 [Balneolaceae bacterium]|nr:hypothetical protein [Balneolaceae bacterium]
MPNGGAGNCSNCKHLNEKNDCILRSVKIQIPHWTVCKNWNQDDKDPIGPLYAIVGEVRNGAVSYGMIPYFEGQRVDTVQQADGDTTVRFTDNSGEIHEFDNVKEYMDFYEKYKEQ